MKKLTTIIALMILSVTSYSQNQIALSWTSPSSSQYQVAKVFATDVETRTTYVVATRSGNNGSPPFEVVLQKFKNGSLQSEDVLVDVTADEYFITLSEPTTNNSLTTMSIRYGGLGSWKYKIVSFNSETKNVTLSSTIELSDYGYNYGSVLLCESVGDNFSIIAEAQNEQGIYSIQRFLINQETYELVTITALPIELSTMGVLKIRKDADAYYAYAVQNPEGIQRVVKMNSNFEYVWTSASPSSPDIWFSSVSVGPQLDVQVVNEGNSLRLNYYNDNSCSSLNTFDYSQDNFAFQQGLQNGYFLNNVAAIVAPVVTPNGDGLQFCSYNVGTSETQEKFISVDGIAEVLSVSGYDQNSWVFVAKNIDDNLIFFEILSSNISVHENTFVPEISIFPNPTADFISVTGLKPSDASIRIISLDGKILLETKVVSDQVVTLDVQHLVPGTYVVQTGTKSMLVVKN